MVITNTGTIPLYRLFNLAAGDHLYIKDPNFESATKFGLSYEGIAGYIF